MFKTRNLKKVLLFMVIVLGVLFSIKATYAASNVAIYINGTRQSIPADMGAPFVDSKNRTQVPVRFVAEKLGHEVKWNSKKQTVTIDGKIVLTINNKSVKTPNGTVTMDTVPFVKGGRTFVPIRFVSECLGYKVDYKFVAGENCVLITKGSATNPGTNNNQTTGGKYAAQSYDWSDYQGTLLSKYYISASKVGTNSNNTTTRQVGTSWEDERTYLNSLITQSNYGFAKDGQMTLGSPESIKNESMGGSTTPVAIYESKDGKSREITIRGWVYSTTTDASKMAIVGQNTVIEAFKYYSNSVQDGLAIYEYVNKCFNTYTDPVYGESKTFGSTTVTFHDNARFGMTVEFDAK